MSHIHGAFSREHFVSAHLCGWLSLSIILHFIYFFSRFLSDYTHGINSDPVTLFAIVYSALIHDLDHQGISNVQLMKEDPAMAQKYQQKSVAGKHNIAFLCSLYCITQRYQTANRGEQYHYQNKTRSTWPGNC